MKEPELVLEWLDLSQHLKDGKKVDTVADILLGILSRSTGVDKIDYTTVLKRVNRETLRLARVRADVLAMLLWRRFFTKMLNDPQPVSLYLFADASPQWRGVEIFCASFDFIAQGVFLRRMLPIIGLSRRHLDTRGKTLALCWQLWLVCGPHYETFRQCCRQVRSLTTDFGVEHLIVDAMNESRGFFRQIDERARDHPEDLDNHLFPRAITIPGWKHMFDGLTKTGLSTLRFFPGWLTGLKNIIGILRVKISVEAIEEDIRNRGFDGLADLLSPTSLVSFAQWRWGTLATACRQLRPLLGGLAEHFDPNPLIHGSRDPAGLHSMTDSLRSAQWRRRFEYVAWFSAWLDSLSQWIGGCPCHERERMEGQAIECPYAGRRLPEAAAKSSSILRAGLDAANGWSEEYWGLPAEHDDMVGVVRATFLLAERKTAFLGRLPWLIAQLPAPGVKERIQQQWREAPREHHHRATQLFMDDFAAELDDIDEHGEGVSDRLRSELECWAGIPMDDTVAEAPHAQAKEHSSRAKNTTLAWVASSTRLVQNLHDAKELTQILGASLPAEWCFYKKILQCERSRDVDRNVKMNRKRLHNCIYRMAMLRRNAHGEELVEESGSDDPDEVDAGGENPDNDDDDNDDDDKSSSSSTSSSDSSGGNDERNQRDIVDNEGGGGDDEQGSGGSGPPQGFARNDDSVKLMRQYLRSCLPLNSYITLLKESNDGVELIAYQVLALDTRPVLVKTYDMEGSTEELLFDIGVQPLEIWRPPALSKDDPPPPALEVFVLQDPCTVDVLRLLGGNIMERELWRIWQKRSSDIDGCWCLHSPAKLATKEKLTSDTVPVLALLDELQTAGWSGQPCRTQHTVTAPKLFDHRNSFGKRWYFQCLLSLEDIIGRSVSEDGFHSCGPQAYYKLLLKSTSIVEPGLPAKEYQKMLAKLTGDSLRAARLERRANPAQGNPSKKAKVATAGRTTGDDCSSNGSIVGDGSPRCKSHRDNSSSSSSAESTSSSSSSSSFSLQAGTREETPGAALANLPRGVLGAEIKYVRRRVLGTWTFASRILVRCCNPEHAALGCEKSRSTRLMTDRFGEMAPVIFLGAWLSQAFTMSAEKHCKYKPTTADMCKFAATFEPDLDQ